LLYDTLFGDCAYVLFVRVASCKSVVDSRYIGMEEESLTARNTSRPLPLPPESSSTYETVPCISQNTSSPNSSVCKPQGTKPNSTLCIALYIIEQWWLTECV